MITREQQLEAANRAATAAQFAIEPKGKNWVEALRAKPETLAAFVAAHPSAPAEALYLSTKPKRAWAEAGAPLRVALETFRATFVALVTLLEAEPLPEQPKADPRKFGRRTFEKRDRNPFKRRA